MEGLFVCPATELVRVKWCLEKKVKYVSPNCRVEIVRSAAEGCAGDLGGWGGGDIIVEFPWACL